MTKKYDFENIMITCYYCNQKDYKVTTCVNNCHTNIIKEKKISEISIDEMRKRYKMH